MGRLDGKVVVITGAGSGMGREAALVFSAEGASVCVADVDDYAAAQTAGEAREAFPFTVDVSHAESVTTSARNRSVRISPACSRPSSDPAGLRTSAERVGTFVLRMP
jgi:NAD(P)-dependent dehydrogenase (short-subunit alcohol dehydrogenase family)